MINTNMFDNYVNIDPEYIPDNTTPCHCVCGIKDIVRGTTPEHFFTFPFTKKDVKEIWITYKQNLRVVIRKTTEQVRWGTDGNENTAYFQLTEDETYSFEAIHNFPCCIQARIELINGDTIYSDIYEVEVLEVLDGVEQVIKENPSVVTSVNGKKGTVNLTATDVKALSEDIIDALQEKLVVGEGIKINGNVISTDTDTIQVKWARVIDRPENLGDKYYKHTQTTPNTVWRIEHNLNKYPSVTMIRDNLNSEMKGDVDYVNENLIIITFSKEVAGVAYLN